MSLTGVASPPGWREPGRCMLTGLRDTSSTETNGGRDHHSSILSRPATEWPVDATDSDGKNEENPAYLELHPVAHVGNTTADEHPLVPAKFSSWLQLPVASLPP